MVRSNNTKSHSTGKPATRGLPPPISKLLYTLFNVGWQYGIGKDLLVLLGLVAHTSQQYMLQAIVYAICTLALFNVWELFNKSFLHITIHLEKKREKYHVKICRSLALIGLYLLWWVEASSSNYYHILSVFVQVMAIRIFTDIFMYNGPAFKSLLGGTEFAAKFDIKPNFWEPTDAVLGDLMMIVEVAGTSKNTEEKALGPDEVKIDWERYSKDPRYTHLKWHLVSHLRGAEFRALQKILHGTYTKHVQAF